MTSLTREHWAKISLITGSTPTTRPPRLARRSTDRSKRRSRECPRSVHSLKLRQRQNIPVGIFEPRDLRSAGRAPDVVFVLLNSFVTLKHDSRRAQLLHRRVNVLHFPTERGVLRLADLFHFLNPEHRSADTKH